MSFLSLDNSLKQGDVQDFRSTFKNEYEKNSDRYFFSMQKPYVCNQPNCEDQKAYLGIVANMGVDTIYLACLVNFANPHFLDNNSTFPADFLHSFKFSKLAICFKKWLNEEKLNLSVITSTISESLKTHQKNLIPFTPRQLESAAEAIHQTSQTSDEIFKKSILNVFNDANSNDHDILFKKAIENLHGKKREEMKDNWAKASCFRPLSLFMAIFNNISLFFRVRNLESNLNQIRANRIYISHSPLKCQVPSDFSLSTSPYSY